MNVEDIKVGHCYIGKIPHPVSLSVLGCNDTHFFVFSSWDENLAQVPKEVFAEWAVEDTTPCHLANLAR